ncbi:MAG: GTPase Era [Gammaproteobacteria bacterium]|nr:GTPase Era [Gammaproteobacteria bacterium]
MAESAVSTFRCGYVALIGRPNVGKSTLMNHLLGQKLSITSRKPQTTRHRILGIKTEAQAQIVYVDTPGIHQGDKQALHRYLNRAAMSIIQDVQVIVFLVEALKWYEEDQLALSHCEKAGCPVILAVNKVDQVKDKDKLLPYLRTTAERFNFAAVVPISAKQGTQLDELERRIIEQLPESEPLYPEDQVTDRSVRFLAAEIIREKLVRLLGDELPYATSVEIEKFDEDATLAKIYAVIWVERDNQKAIVIGKDGAKLKRIGQEARVDLENLLEKKVYLKTWVKVKRGWADDERALHQLGYRDEN